MSIAAQIAKILTRYRRSALIFATLISILLIGGLSQLEVRNDYREYFEPDDPLIAATDWLTARQGQDGEIAIVVYRPADRDAFSLISLLQTEAIRDGLRAAPHVLSVESWLDAEKPVFVTAENAWRSAQIASGINVFTEGGRARLRKDALALPSAVRRTIGREGETAAFRVFLDYDSATLDRASRTEALAEAVTALERRLKETAAGDQLFLVGSSLFEYSASETLRHDIRRLAPIAAIGIIVFLWALYRSVPFALASTLIILVPTIATAGLVAILGAPFSNLAVSGLLLVGTLAVADVLHLANGYFLRRAEGGAVDEALEGSIGDNLPPIFATSLTTAFGQVAMFMSAAPPIRTMGMVVTCGVWITLILTTLALPALLAASNSKQPRRLIQLSNIARRLSRFGASNAKPVLAASLLLATLSVVGLSQTRLVDSLGGWFANDTPFRQGMDILDTQYAGAHAFSIAVEATAKDQLSLRRDFESSDTAAWIASFRSQMGAEAGDGSWTSIYDAADMVASHRASDPESSFTVLEPSADYQTLSSETLARAGLMTRLSFGARDYTLWRFEAQDASSFSVVEAAKRIEGQLEDAAEGRLTRITGVGLAFATLSVNNFHSIVLGSLTAFALISLAMFVVLRSTRLGLVSLSPNLFPILVVLGAWSLLYGEVNLAVATVFSVALGIVVDDTIHVLVRYRRRRSLGDDPVTAASEAAAEVGPAIFATTCVLACGFFLLSTSGFLLTAQKAGLVGATVMAALIFDLVALPAIAVLTDRSDKVNG